MKRLKVIVTGATGFLGGWLVVKLVEHGFDLIALLNPAGSSRKQCQYYLKNLGHHCLALGADLTNFDCIRNIVAEHQPDVFIHAAAHGAIEACADNPLATFSTSAMSTATLLEAVRLNSPHTLFISHSTDKVYGGNIAPFREDMLFRPHHIYEVAKVAQEHLTASYASQYGLKTVTVRCGNYFGGYEFNFTRIVPYTIRQCLFGEPIELRSSGKFTRDFLYVEDAALLNIMLIEKYLNRQIDEFGRAYNFSLETSVTVLDLVHRIAHLMGKTPDIVIKDTVKSEIPDIRLDCTRAKTDLGWTPTFSLDEGLIRSIEFYRSFFAEDMRSRGVAP